MPRYTGAFHVHSTFSDGKLSLEQIAALARAQHLDFIVCADHAPYLDASRRAALVQECAALSVDGLLMVPGLEFERDGQHVVALGPGELLGELDAATVVDTPQEVRARGGFTVWAHPAVTFAWTLHKPMQLAYDGWEIWNRRADGSSPSLPVMLALVKALRRGRRLLALAGTDFHKGKVIPSPFVTVEGPAELTGAALLEALRQERYKINCADKETTALRLSLQPISSTVRYGLQRVHCVLALARYRLMTTLGAKPSAHGR